MKKMILFLVSTLTTQFYANDIYNIYKTPYMYVLFQVRL